MSYPVVSLRRYPVKSMGGEPLTQAEFNSRGITGDRWYAVTDAAGHLASGKNTRRFRRHDEVFQYAAVTVEEAPNTGHRATAHEPDGGDAVSTLASVPAEGAVGQVAGTDSPHLQAAHSAVPKASSAPRVRVSHGEQSWEVGEAELNAHLSDSFGTSVKVLPEAETPHFDDGAVSLVGSASLAWCEKEFEINADSRRIRVNIVLDTDEPFVEEGWIGRELHVGGVVLRVVQQIPRCRMIDLDQDGVTVDGKWLKPLGRERGGNMGVYAQVVQPGIVTVGDTLTVK